MKYVQKLNFQNYLDYVCNKNSLNIINLDVIKVFDHINKLDKLIVLSISSYLFILSILSRIIYFKSFYRLKLEQIHNLVKVLLIFNFIISKIDQIIYISSLLHIYSNENLIKNNQEIQCNTSKSNDSYSRFIVIGSGPSGAVTALELSKVYQGQVLVIEKGNSYNIPKTKHPGDEFSKKWYRGGINSTYFPQMIAYSSASCYGGGSEINSGLFHEPDEEFLNRWNTDYGTEGLDTESINEHINKVRELVSGSKFNKNFGELFAKGVNQKSKNLKILKKFSNSTNDKKNSMSETLLKKFIQNNGIVELSREVEKINYNNNKWILKTCKNGKIKKFTCDYLFLCCGSLFTNNLMIKSRVAVDKKNIINTFKFHPMIKMIGSFSENIQNLNEDVIPHQNLEYYPKFIIGNASSSIQFLKSSFTDSSIIKFIDANWKKMKIFHATFSIGSGKIINIPFIKDPFLLYFFKKDEKKLIHFATLKLFNFIKQAKAEYIIPLTQKNSKIFKTKKSNKLMDKNVKIKNFQISSVHILGGITMGENSKCVANSYGKINNYEGLYVNDSSLINNQLLKKSSGYNNDNCISKYSKLYK